MKTLFIVFLLLVLSGISFSQNENLTSEHISLENGVANNLIYSIYQDSKGFVWFGTMFGLVRYDGVNYKTYRFDPLDSNSLSNDDIISIYEDRSGYLWFGTYKGGLNKFYRTTGKFTRYLHDAENPNTISNNTVWAIIQDKKGAMWFATEGGGLSNLDTEKNEFTVYKRDTTKEGSISGNFIRSLAEDRDGNLWAGTVGTGLNKFDPQNKTFINYRNNTTNTKSLSSNSVTSVFEDSDGELWIGTGGGGLNKMNKATGEFVRYKYDSTDKFSLSSNFIHAVNEDSPGKLLIGTQTGLNRFDKVSGEFFKYNIYPENTRKNETVIAFKKDISGVIWVSSYMDGLYKLSHTENKFSSMLNDKNVNCIYEDKSGVLWIGTARNGLYKSSDNGKNFISYTNEENNPASISSHFVTSLAEDMEGNLWIGTDRGLNLLQKNSDTFIKFFNEPGNESSLGNNRIRKIIFDEEGSLWIGTNLGLDKFIKSNESFIHYRHSFRDTNSLIENTILSIYEDKNHDLWTGTFGGLSRLNKKTGKFRHYKQDPNDPKSISNNYVFSFCEDSNNNFWIGTGGGLNIFDRNTETFFHFTERDGLPNGVIAGLEAGNDGHLWISTFKGISRFSVKNKEFKNYDTYDGIVSNMFNTGSYYKNSKEVIFFGSINGVNYFNPETIKESNFNAPVILTSLTKYDERDKNEIDISAKNEVELNYNDNIINIGFSSVDYTNPRKNKFAYKLEGFDKDWNYSENKNEAIYTNLNPGVYVFKVKGTNSNGVWGDKEASIQITVIPPFWKTWWFYGILICSVAGGIIFIQNYRVRQKVKNLIELEKIKENEREMMREQASRDYHDELGHKLTRISMYSRRINKKLRLTANGLTEDLNSIVETSNSLQSGAKDLIWAMNPKEDTFYDFTVRLRDFGNEFFENTGITFHADVSKLEFRNINLSMNCKRHMMYIFKEGMNNILKYSRCQNVTLMFLLREDAVVVVLKDDGKGFDPHDCPKGYGLKNIYSRAKQMNIDVDISSELNTGTVIKLRAGIANLISI